MQNLRSPTETGSAGVVHLLLASGLLALVAGCDRKSASDPPAAAGPAVATVPAVERAKADPKWAGLSEPVAIGDVRVTLLQVGRGKLDLQTDSRGKKTTMPDVEETLWVKLRIENTSGAKILRYSSWGRVLNPTAQLTDEHGNSYGPRDNRRFPPVDGVDSATIRPGESITDVVRFEVPVDAAKRFRLELKHPEREGDPGPFRFEFARDAIGAPSAKK